MAVQVRAGIATAIVLALLAAPGHSMQGRLQAGPTLLEVDTRAGATRLTLRNTGDAPVGAQVRVFTWDQVDGEDTLTPTDDFAVSPPISEVPAGGHQVVRLVRLQGGAGVQDRTYRVVAEELPRRPDDGTSEARSTVAMRMRYVIPLFDRADGAPPAQVSCALTSETGRWRLTCRNTGGRAAQLGATRLRDADGLDLALSQGLFGYVLPGRERSWRVDEAALRDVHGPVRLETHVDGKPATLPVAHGAP